ncbi:uncharacterized protein [Diadema antillarum]|uniref:uncharacterized protein n=1 Tax=Diadema antillarum TaxID=105358 RepID=UPI003A87E4D7
MNNASLFGIFKKVVKLTKDPTNGCRVVQSQRHFALSPRYLGRLKKGALETLEGEIGRYSESLQAIPLAYTDLKLLQSTGSIFDDQPFIHFDVTFKAVVFQPTLGSVLKCQVNEYAGDHVSCLVHDWFNLSFPLHDPDLEKRLPRGSKVMAMVTHIQAKDGLTAIKATPTGDRFPELQGSSKPPVIVPKEEPLDEVDAGVGQTFTALDKKQKHDSGFFSNPEESFSEVMDDDAEKRKKKKKKKKEKEKSDTERTDCAIGIKQIKVEPHTEEICNTERLSASEQRDVKVEEGSKLVGEGIQKKKKKKRKEREMDGGDKILMNIKVEVDSPEDNDIAMSCRKGKNTVTSESKLCVRGSGMEEKEHSLEIKTEESTAESHQVKKKKKKNKAKDMDCPQSAALIRTPRDMEDVLESKVQNRPTNLKRTHSPLANDMNGSVYHSERTTQNEVCRTRDESSPSLPKKKKKHKHQMEWV